MSRALLALMVVLLVGLFGPDASLAVGAEPSPLPTGQALGEPFVSGDPRSDGAGPGIVGSPLAILLGVVMLGVLTAGLTVVVVRLRGQP